MKVLITCLALQCTLLSMISAQSISGKLTDGQETAVVFANVVLFSAADSTIIKVETTNDAGNFTINQVEAGSYYLSASYIGLSDYNSEVFQFESSDLDLGTLVLADSGVELETAVVTARRSLVEIKPDRTVFNVEGTINSAGDNGLGLLRKAPGVLLDNNDNITVLGRSGVLIYVDGKRLPIAGDELTAYLQALPADQIDRIDIITNPGAKYEAEGNAGIIDIRMKRDKSMGLNGSVSLTASRGEIFRGNVSSLLNYRNKNFNVFGTVGYNHGKWFEDYIFDSSQNGFRLLDRLEWLGNQNGPNLRLGTDYYLSKHHTIGFLVTGGSNGGDFNSDGINRISSDLVTNFGVGLPKEVVLPVDVIDSILISQRIGVQERLRSTYNLNYAYVKEEQSINFDLDYGRFRTTNMTDQPNTYFDNTQTNILSFVGYSFNTPIDIDIYTAKIDYESPLAGGKFGLGSKVSFVSTDNFFEFFDGVGDLAVINNMNSNQFTYDEKVYAGYLSYNRQLSEKLSLSTGLRAEQTMTSSQLTTYSESMPETARDSSYLSFFPSGGLTFTASQRSIWSINYGRRINRPDYNVLNPFRSQVSELGFNIGNPTLKPEIVNNIEVGYTLDYRYNFKLAYSVTTDQITRLIGTDDSDPRASFINWDNLAKQTVISFNASLPFELSDRWNAFFNLSANSLSNEAEYPDGNTIDLQAFSYNIFQQHTYKLPKGYVAELSSWYSGPGIWGGVFEYESSYAINLGLQKKFFQDKLSVKLAVQDITNQSFWNGKSEFDGLLSYGQGSWDNRRGSISLTYSFGNDQVKQSRQRQTGLESESERVEGN